MKLICDMNKKGLWNLKDVVDKIIQKWLTEDKYIFDRSKIIIRKLNTLMDKK